LFWFQCKRLRAQFQAGGYGPIGRLGGALWRETKCSGKRQNKVPKHSHDGHKYLVATGLPSHRAFMVVDKNACRRSKSTADRTHCITTPSTVAHAHFPLSRPPDAPPICPPNPTPATVQRHRSPP